MILLPDGLKALKRVAKMVGLDLGGAYLNLDSGFDSKHNRTCIFNAGMIPNITENPRNRKRTKRGRKRLFNAAIHALRMRVDRTFAWEDTCKRLLLRFEHMQPRQYMTALLTHFWQWVPLPRRRAQGPAPKSRWMPVHTDYSSAVNPLDFITPQVHPRRP
jgi:hypothetical protein